MHVDTTPSFFSCLGTTEFNETMFVGDRPMFLICFFVASDAFQGSYAKNPLRFETVNITAAQVCGLHNTAQYV